MESPESAETLETISCLDTFRCGICQFEVNDLEMFLIHKQTCVTENVNIITESEYHAANQVEEPAAAEEVKIIETALSEHPIIIDRLTCTICLKKFKKTYNLNQHFLIHTNDKPFKCEICGKAFVQKSNLTKHLIVHSSTAGNRNKISQFEEKVSFEVLTKSGRKIAVEPQRMLQCKNCEFEISNSDWKSHQLLCQNNEGSQEIFKCDECLSIFGSLKLLKNHQKRCEKKPEKEGLSYQCSICQKKFACQDYLKKHFSTHDPESEHKCDICNKSFKRSDNLKRHMNIHTDSAKVYKCPFANLIGCKKEFKRYDKLKDHIKTHGNVKQTICCDQCQELFFDTKELDEHILTSHKVTVEIENHESIEEMNIEVIDDETIALSPEENENIVFLVLEEDPDTDSELVV